MEEFVFVDGKKYRRGYTTGSCATACCKACLIMYLSGEKVDYVDISTPKGIDLKIDVFDSVIENNMVECRVVKDGGDDIDVTHKMDIYSRLEIVPKDYVLDYKCDIDLYGIEITGGEGIGRVTKKGLSTEVGRPAINPTPLKMIKKELELVLEEYFDDVGNIFDDKKMIFTIFAPRGEEIAKNTFNSNLGIVDGISIIGTTGIVEPMSDEGWKKSLSAELSIKSEEGLKEVVLVPGNIGYEKMVNDYNTSPDTIVKMSNFIGYMLMECKRLGFEKITIAGHIGKLIKLSGGITNTHSRVSDARREIMVANLALLGCPLDVLKKVDACITTDAMIPIIDESSMEEVYSVLCRKAAEKAWRYLRDGKENIEIEVMMFSMDKRLLSSATYNKKDK